MNINEILVKTNLKDKENLTSKDFLLMSIYLYIRDECPEIYQIIENEVDTVKALNLLTDDIWFRDEEFQYFLDTIEYHLKTDRFKYKKEILKGLTNKSDYQKAFVSIY